ncbi:DBH-like monooxygenase protein 2 homolog [Megalops cyprinoides]|uniref:DBH-like monooxygenase protein 2 homolog n=1 Tax=Megalops cyprinoides TaxID=118141 RepID=UPI001864D55C|nr:DBH-like monooxygenase protein 2 homolog [Megalops cyprinoides]
MGTLLLVSALLVWPLRSGAQGDQLPLTEHLDQDQNVTLRWGFDETRDEITFELTVKTTGWVGLGFSPNGGMAGADIVIGGVSPNGSTYFTDRHAVGQSLPLVDARQSYTLLSLAEADGQTTMKFQRSIQSCDADDFAISTSPIKLIYAFGLTDEIKYHSSRRGTKEVNLLKYSPRTSSTGGSYFDITANNFTVPSVHTYYHCRIVKLPTLGSKHHVYRIEPVIQNPDLVHHMLLYYCSPSVNETLTGMCYSAQLHAFHMCMGAMATWAIGGGGFDIPEAAGISIGGDNDVSYYRLEIHYNNQEQVSGRIDDSGLRFHYTPVLRQYDASILSVGLIVDKSYVIPPNATSFKSYALCKTSLISQLLPSPVPDLNIFMVMLHTHLAGRKIRVGHFRNGEQIDFLALDEHYDFELQQALFLGKIKNVKLGDELVVECTYNTVNRTRLTELGLATTDEMCFAYMFYYPAIDINNCWSIPDIGSIDTANNHAVQIGYIPELKATPSVDCRAVQGAVTPAAGAATAHTPGITLLLWLAALRLL